MGHQDSALGRKGKFRVNTGFSCAWVSIRESATGCDFPWMLESVDMDLQLARVPMRHEEVWAKDGVGFPILWGATPPEGVFV